MFIILHILSMNLTYHHRNIHTNMIYLKEEEAGLAVRGFDGVHFEGKKICVSNAEIEQMSDLMKNEDIREAVNKSYEDYKEGALLLPEDMTHLDYLTDPYRHVS